MSRGLRACRRPALRSSMPRNRSDCCKLRSRACVSSGGRTSTPSAIPTTGSIRAMRTRSRPRSLPAWLCCVLTRRLNSRQIAIGSCRASTQASPSGRRRWSALPARRSWWCTTAGRISPTASACGSWQRPSRIRASRPLRQSWRPFSGACASSNVRVLIADPHANPALVRQITEKGGAKPVTLLPSGTDYIALIEENVKRLSASLNPD